MWNIFSSSAARPTWWWSRTSYARLPRCGRRSPPVRRPQPTRCRGRSRSAKTPVGRWSPSRRQKSSRRRGSSPRCARRRGRNVPPPRPKSRCHGRESGRRWSLKRRRCLLCRRLPLRRASASHASPIRCRAWRTNCHAYPALPSPPNRRLAACRGCNRRRRRPRAPPTPRSSRPPTRTSPKWRNGWRRRCDVPVRARTHARRPRPRRRASPRPRARHSRRLRPSRGRTCRCAGRSRATTPARRHPRRRRARPLQRRAMRRRRQRPWTPRKARVVRAPTPSPHRRNRSTTASNRRWRVCSTVRPPSLDRPSLDRRSRGLRTALARSFPCARFPPGRVTRHFRYSPLRQTTSLVAIDALAPLMTLLRLDRERGDGARLEPLERNRLAGLLAIAVGAVLEAGEGRVDLGDQLALAVAGPQLDRPVGFRGRAVRKIGVILVFSLEMGQRLPGLFEDLLLPGEQLLAEILPLALIHEGLFVGRSIGLGLV